jgi:hypothetical protein
MGFPGVKMRPIFEPERGLMRGLCFELDWCILVDEVCLILFGHVSLYQGIGVGYQDPASTLGLA